MTVENVVRLFLAIIIPKQSSLLSYAEVQAFLLVKLDWHIFCNIQILFPEPTCDPFT
jgi:hypothetical protein